MQYRVSLFATFLATTIPSAAHSIRMRANGTNISASGALNIPAVGDVEAFSAPKVITDTFDGAMKEFDRGVTCGDGENGSDSAVFILEDGASLSNVIIGAAQREGVHCKGKCKLTNVFFRKVCEGT